jgi:hypothetical protein
VIGWLAWTTGVLGLGVGVLAGVATARGRRIDDLQLLTTAALEVVLVVQAVAGCVALARTERAVDAVVFLGYLITSVLVPPLGAFWALGERSRWGTGVLMIAGVTSAVLVLRLEQVWRTGG